MVKHLACLEPASRKTLSSHSDFLARLIPIILSAETNWWVVRCLVRLFERAHDNPFISAAINWGKERPKSLRIASISLYDRNE